VQLYCFGHPAVTPAWGFIGFYRKRMLSGVSLSTSTQCCTSWTDNLKDLPHTFTGYYIRSYKVIVSIAVLINPRSHVPSYGTICTSQGLLSVFQHQILKYEHAKGNNAYQVNLYSAFPVLLIVHSSIINHNIQPSKMLNYFFEGTYSKIQG